MFFYLILLFTIVPALELMVLIEVGSVIGSFNTILIIILTGGLGAALARLQGFAVLRNIQKNLNEGRMPTDDMVNGVMIFAGGLLLLTPGFLTDTLGFLLLIPWTREIIKIIVKQNMGKIIVQHNYPEETPRTGRPRTDFEDAEFHD